MPDMPVEDMDGRPTANSVVELSNDSFQRHSTRISEWNRMMNLVNRKFKPFAWRFDTDTYKPIIPGTAGNLVHGAAVQIVSDTPVVEYAPRDNSNAAQQDADAGEKAGQAWLSHFSMSAVEPPFVTAAKHAILGMWALKGPTFDFNAWGEPPTRGRKTNAAYHSELGRYRIRQAERPAFKVEAVDPTTIVWDESSPYNPRWVIERINVPTWKVGEHFRGIFTNPRSRKMHEHTVIQLFTSEQWRMVLADDEIVSWWEEHDGKRVTGAVENHYGYQLYQLGFGPWSFLGKDPEDAARSMLYFVEDELVEQARIKSLKRWQAQLYGLTPLVSGDPERTAAELKSGPAPVLSARGDDLNRTAPRPMEMPRPPEWLDDYEAKNDATIRDHTYTQALSGYREPGTTSGVMSGLHIGEARQIFRPITIRMSQQASRILNRCAYIHEHMIEEPVSLWLEATRGRELMSVKPEQWRDSYHFKVDFEPVDPTRDDRRAMLGINMHAQGLLDIWTVLEDYIRHPDSTGVVKRLMKWKVMQDPRYFAVMASEAAKEIGLVDKIAELEAAEQAAQAGDIPNNARTTGDFAPVDGANLPQAGVPSQNSEVDFPTRGEPLEAQGRLSPRVSEPLNDRASGFRR